MIVYPAIDLMGGHIVRLRQGRFDDATYYDADPVAALSAFASSGARWAHLVDLDGARAGRPVQQDLIAEVVKATGLKLQVGGGLRESAQIEALFAAGVERVVIGSLAVIDPQATDQLFDRFGAERLALSLDVRLVEGVPLVVTSGWSETSALSLWDAAARYPRMRHLLLTDVGRDGMLSGPNFDLLDEAGTRLPQVDVQASGGISSLADLRALRTAGAIVGKALWDGRFTLEEALDAVA